MSDFQFTIVGDASKADKAIDSVLAELDKVAANANAAGQRITAAFSAAKGAADKAAGDAQKAAQANTTFKQRVNDVADALVREQQMLDRIHGPMQRAQQDIKILNDLHARGEISARQHAEQLEHVHRAAGLPNPAAAVSLPSLPTSAPGGGISGLAGGLALLGGGAALVAGAQQLAAIDDQFRNLHNSALKFVDAEHNVSKVLADQEALAHSLNSTVEQTIGTYDAVRDATDELGLSYEQQIRLTRTLDEAAQIGGKTGEAAASAFYNLKVAFETGQNPGRAIIGIFKQFPDVQSQLQASLKMTAREIVDMAEQGKLSFADFARGMTTNTDDIDRKFGLRIKTWSQQWHEFTYALEKPISLENMLAPFGTLDETIGSVLAKMQRIQDMFDKQANLTGTYTPTRLATSDDASKGFVNARINEREDAKRQLEGLNQAYKSGQIEADIYRQKKEQLEATISGVVAAFHKENAEAKRLAEEYAKLGQALLGVESASQRAIARGAAERAAGEERAKWISDLEAATFDNVSKYEAEMQQLNAAVNSGELSWEAYAIARQKAFESNGGHGLASSNFNAPGVDYNAAKDNVAKSAQALNEWRANARAVQQQIADDAKKHAEEVNAAWGKGLGSIGRSFIDAALEGKQSFAHMAESMLEDIAMLTIKMAAMKAIEGGAFGGKGSVGAGVLGGLLGFATGGVIYEGTGGGTDNQIVAFRKSTDERVTIETPDQVQSGALRGGGGSTTVQNVIHVQSDPREIASGIGSYSGKREYIKLNREFNRRR